MADNDLIRICWKADRETEPVMFRLVSEDPEYAFLEVSVSSDEMTERVAKAKLMQRMYELGKEKGIAPRRLRFRINGIED